MNRADFVGPPCGCGECVQAGVSQLPQRRDPHSGRMLHGYDLRGWYLAYERFRAAARAAVGPKAPRGGGFSKLAGGKHGDV